MKAPHLWRGRNSENIAQRWLRARGLRPVAANYRCRHGEIDLIMLDESCLAFIEVRFRADHRFGGALHSVTPAKQNRIIRTASHFLQTHRDHQRRPMRFDVIGMSRNADDIRIEWLQRAFVAAGD